MVSKNRNNSTTEVSFHQQTNLAMHTKCKFHHDICCPADLNDEEELHDSKAFNDSHGIRRYGGSRQQGGVARFEGVWCQQGQFQWREWWTLMMKEEMKRENKDNKVKSCIPLQIFSFERKMKPLGLTWLSKVSSLPLPNQITKSIEFSAHSRVSCWEFCHSWLINLN